MLPPLRALARRYDVSHETIRQALRALEQEGLVQIVRAFGTVVRGPNEGDAKGVSWSAERSFFSPVHAVSPVLQVASCEYVPQKQDTWDALAAHFHRHYPQTTVRLKRYVPGLVEESRGPLDVIHDAAYQIEELGARGLLLNLHPMLAADPALQQQGWVADLGRNLATEPCWGLPVSFDLGATFINLELVQPEIIEQLRGNWSIQAIMEWAASLPRERKIIRPVAWPRPHVLLAFFGIDTADLGAMEATLGRLPSVLEQILSWERAGLGYGTDDSLRGDMSEEVYLGFTQRRIGMAFQHTFMIPHTAAEARFPWQVCRLPIAPGITPRRFTTTCGILKTTAVPDLAWKFVRFLASSEAENLFAVGNTNVPALRAALRSTEFRERIRGMDDLIEPAEASREWREQESMAFLRSRLALWDREVFAFLGGKQSSAETVDHLRPLKAEGVGPLGVKGS